MKKSLVSSCGWLISLIAMMAFVNVGAEESSQPVPRLRALRKTDSTSSIRIAAAAAAATATTTILDETAATQLSDTHGRIMDDEPWSVGTHVYKDFGADEGWFFGAISFYDETGDTYEVIYEDDDTEVFGPADEAALEVIIDNAEVYEPYAVGQPVQTEAGRTGVIVGWEDWAYLITWDDTKVTEKARMSSEVDDMVLAAGGEVDGDTDAPTEGGDTDAPTEGGDTDAPTEGGDTDAPTEGGDTDAPTEGGDTDAPTEGGDTSAPTEGGDTDAPTEGGDTDAPTEGQLTDAPTEDEDDASSSSPSGGSSANLFSPFTNNGDGTDDDNNVTANMAYIAAGILAVFLGGCCVVQRRRSNRGELRRVELIAEEYKDNLELPQMH